MKKILILISVLIPITLIAQNNKQVESWLTTADKKMLIEKQDEIIEFTQKNKGKLHPIVIDENMHFQTVDGFGFALTGGSAELLIKMDEEQRKELLRELFSDEGVGISYIRLTIGASDLNSFVFSYNDLETGQTDFELKSFSLSQDLIDVVPVMKEILDINPDIKVMSSPWSAPAWMKTNSNVRGGALKKECYDVYARYFVKYIQQMSEKGISIDAVTVQNEPLNSRNTPSMQWFYHEQGDFIKNHLGPYFDKNGIDTKIILFDHNLDRIDYPLALLNDPEVDKYVVGSAFHYYAGDVGAMNVLHIARPDKNIYFTEQMLTERWMKEDYEIASAVKKLIIDVTRNWSKNVILWNLAADPNDDPHTDNGGCPFCQGAITIDKNVVSRNIAYYTIAHISKFVPSGSKRIGSTKFGDKTVLLTEDEEQSEIKRANVIQNSQVFPNVAFRTPENKIVLIVANNSFSKRNVKVQYRGKYFNAPLEPGAVATYVWKIFD